MYLEKYRHPRIFYGIAVIIPWTLWLIWGALSHSPLHAEQGWAIFGSILGLLGLMTPMMAALALILRDKDMRKELKTACFDFRGIHWKWWALTFLLPPMSILLAQALSLLFGHSAEQFKFAEEISFSAGIFPAWVVLILAPIIEEFGWHTYGVHCIRRRFNLFAVCVIFGIIWGIWHIPLAAVDGYYQSNVAESGVVYSINFLVSLIPYLIIDNWRYYKTNRNLFLVIAFHLLMGFSNEIFQTHPDSKVIQTALLCVMSAVIVFRDRKFFFDKAYAG